MVKAVEAHADVPWVVLYVKRWLPAPLALPDGTLRRGIGAPRRGPRSRRCWPTCSCTTRSTRGWPGSIRASGSSVMPTTWSCTVSPNAKPATLVAAIGDRMEQVGLRLHPDKTKIVYCKDGNRRLDYGLTAFTFLGFTFRARAARTKNGAHLRLVPAGDQQDAQNKISGQIRRWRLHRRIGLTLAELAR